MNCTEALKKYPDLISRMAGLREIWSAVRNGAKAEEECERLRQSERAIVNECFGLRQDIEAGMDERRHLTAEVERLKAERDLARGAISDDDHWAQGVIALSDENYQQRATIAAQQARIEKLEKFINTPELDDFMEAVKREAAHQQERWGSEHDAGKAPQDWFWLLGYLSGKALRAAIDGDDDKARHHTISSAAALLNWHAHISGTRTAMRPGIDDKERRLTALLGEDVNTKI